MRLLRLLCAMCTFGVLNAQPTFKTSYNAPGDQEVRWMESLADGSIVVAGRSSNGTSGGNDAFLLKTTPDGAVDWAFTYGSSGSDQFNSVKATNDGGFLAVGAGGSSADAFLVKTDGGGGVEWQRYLGGSGNDGALNATEIADGYLVSGFDGSAGQNAFVAKLDLSGNVLWNRSLGVGSIGGEPQESASGNIHVPVGVLGDCGLVTLSSTGGLLGNTRYIGPGNEALYHLKPGGPGFFASDHTWSFGPNIPKGYVLAVNTSGGLVWAKTYQGLGVQTRVIANPTSDGGLTFSLWYETAPQPTAILVKTDDAGNLQWAKLHTLVAGSGRIRLCREVANGGYAAAGEVTVAGSGLDVIIIRTNGEGNIAGCCPVDASVIVASVTPTLGTVGYAPSDLTANASGSDVPIGLVPEAVDRCSGPLCCLTDAGTMTFADLNLCTNETASAVHNGDEELDTNDGLDFIIYTNPNNPTGSILLTADQPTFAFTAPPLQTGTTYYIAAIAGNLSGGSVQLSDPCLDVSDSIRVVWQPLPSITFDVDDTNLCPGACLSVELTFTGSPPFTLTYDAGGNTTTQTFSGLTDSFLYCAPAGATIGPLVVQATALSDAQCTCD